MILRSAFLAGVLVVAATAAAQRPEPEVFAVIDGDSMFTLLPPDAIAALHEPVYVTGEAAAAQMRDDEPVIGVIVGEDARAYSLWQLDHHEIVNDTVGGRAIAATW